MYSLLSIDIREMAPSTKDLFKKAFELTLGGLIPKQSGESCYLDLVRLWYVENLYFIGDPDFTDELQQSISKQVIQLKQNLMSASAEKLQGKLFVQLLWLLETSYAFGMPSEEELA